MAPLTPVVLDSVVTRSTSLGEATRNAESLKQRATAFDAALSRQSGTVPSGQQPTQLAQAETTGQASGVDAAGSTERARRGLELEGAREVGKTTGGDLILDGLQKLRANFDQRHAKVSEMMKSNVVDASTLLAMQVEVVNYTMMIDLTSKLTGKSTQSFDTLMKGQ